ncbi:hypothetical protein EVAR_42051_1 [Eumeta japonica]|uniref:Uncharacterized protein n=1 Tax=Eumeta variegata TaxID=151549 RepID=A0A4C1XVW0_EUMVA|nr:hypothetical protein EVAR_42051_1 [Eumeta japonica]
MQNKTKQCVKARNNEIKEGYDRRASDSFQENEIGLEEIMKVVNLMKARKAVGSDRALSVMLKGSRVSFTISRADHNKRRRRARAAGVDNSRRGAHALVVSTVTSFVTVIHRQSNLSSTASIRACVRSYRTPIKGIQICSRL